jgi:hypothetical protein
MLPGLDGTGLLFRPLVAAMPDTGTKVVSYPNDKALSLDEHARWAIRNLPGGKAVLVAESFSGLVALRVLQEARSCGTRRRFSCASFASAPMRLSRN